MNVMQKHRIQEFAREYVSKKNLPVLFEALMTGLMVEKPDDHFKFIVDSINKCKDQEEPIRWDQFISKKGGLFNVLEPIPVSNKDFESKDSNIDSIKDYRFISLIGLPGVDKRLHAEKIANKFQFTLISISDLLNQRIKENDEIAQDIDQTIKSGRLVSTKIILDLIEENLKSRKFKKKTILLNGFPRSREQAEQMENSFNLCSLLIYINNTKHLIGEDLSFDDDQQTLSDQELFQKTRRDQFVAQTLPMLDKLEWKISIVDIDLSLPENEQHNQVESALEQIE